MSEKRRIVFADCDIPLGARVLVRGMRATPAADDVANGTAAPRPAWVDEGECIRKGQTFSVFMDEGLGARSLSAIANGPIMEPSVIYLPAGKLSMEEFRARQRSIILEEPGA